VHEYLRRETIFYNVGLFEAAAVRRMLGHYRNLLEGVAADPDRRLAELPLLTEAERYQLRVQWNATEAAYPERVCMHEPFEAQAERTPGTVAVSFEDQQLTSRGLNLRANRLAHHLQAVGVVPDTLVGLCLERSLEMVVALLGILKAGGACVPLDPEHPPERLALMVRDAEPAVRNQAPSAFRQPIQAEGEGGAGAGELSLRLALFGGEALDVEMLRPWFRRHGDQRPRLVNRYGITETTAHVTYRPPCAVDLVATRGSPIGTPSRTWPFTCSTLTGSWSRSACRGRLTWVAGALAAAISTCRSI
jgi:non-ribosomal peptide synthetase component F